MTIPTSQDFEKLGVFYIGRPYSIKEHKAGQGIVLYDSRDLLTHAVCVGMTGSGKTGLCISLIEEAAMDSIPVLAIDPKGDLTNLLLTFPDLEASDFAPWVDSGEAERKGLSVDLYAQQQAELWKKGLESWGESGERIQKMRQNADFAIYTPGSSAGRGLSLLKSFDVPEASLLEDGELFRERVSTTVTSLLGLAGIDADPVRSREHILLCSILDDAWRNNQNLDLGSLIQRIQQPPFNRVGVMDLDAFFPAKERFELAMSINSLLASPSFADWMEGEPLDIGSLLYAKDSRPRVSIISIAHLNDAERMFVVSLILNQMLGWVRRQSGTASLRAILYIDELFGYLPPVANPPSKQPLMTLLKQARAFGVGVVMATQNPVDLDYKGLSNTGTWFIGRLQTERDKARVMEGLEGAAASQGGNFRRQEMEEILAGLGSRVFLMNNVHNDAPIVFESRWAMSYLRGPLTRNQIKQISATSDQSTALAVPINEEPPQSVSSTKTASRSDLKEAGSRPVLPPGINQYFVPLRSASGADVKIVYQPMILGAAEISYDDRKSGVSVSRDVMLLASLADKPGGLEWEEATPSDVGIDELESTPEDDASYEGLPSAASDPRKYASWSKDLVNFLYRSQALQLMRSPTFNRFSNIDENERDFRIRLQHLAHEDRDAGLAKLEQKYAPKLNTINERIRRAEQTIQKERSQSGDAKMQTVLNVGSTLLGALFGNRTFSSTNIGRAASSARSASRAMRESQDVGRAEETLGALEAQLAEMQERFKRESEDFKTRTDPSTESLETVDIKPKKKDITVKLVALVWVPRS